jgi:Na+-transporting methylmalonyl-CoA/oxaloacetate decarboxylase gamma subunit
MEMEMVLKGLQVSVYGLSGVLAVLALFYLVTKIMVIIFSRLSHGDRKTQK